MSLLAACPDDGKTGPLPAAEALAGGAVPAAPSTDAAPLVDQRYDALATALDRRDQAAALDAVLSLKTSSSMVGGLRLAELAAELEEVIRSGSLSQAASRLGDVAARGNETVDELQFSYILWER